MKGTMGNFAGLVGADGTLFYSDTNYGFHEDENGNEDSSQPIWAATAKAEEKIFPNGQLLTGVSWDPDTITFTASGGATFSFDFYGGGLSGSSSSDPDAHVTSPEGQRIVRVGISVGPGQWAKLTSKSAVLATSDNTTVIVLGVVIVLALGVGYWMYSKRQTQNAAAAAAAQRKRALNAPKPS